MAFTQEDKDKMDEAAISAERDIRDTELDTFRRVATWWKKWYLKTGHKRLARVLLQYAPKEDSP